MNRFHRNSDVIHVKIPKDKKGMVERKCPSQGCGKYFKLKPGTGLKGEIPCRCPYCGFAGRSDVFTTPEQKRYAKTAAMNYASEELHRVLKSMEFETRPQGPLGISVSMKVSGGPERFHCYYRSKELETEVVCDACSLVYAIYGAFALCPDCGSHNSLTVLGKNIEFADKLLAIAAGQDREMGEHLRGDALENIVSAFDGFGREVCRLAAPSATSASDAQVVSFQNLTGAANKIKKLFGFDLMGLVSKTDWEFACRSFQKRHVLAHRMGVVDDAYLAATNDPDAVAGRKVSITADDVKLLGGVALRIAQGLATRLIPPPTPPQPHQ